MIIEDYVSFETANLLEEKGFPQLQDNCGYFTTEMIYSRNVDKNGEHHFVHQYPAGVYNKDKYIAAPTLQMAMKFLRKVYGIDIEVRTHYLNRLKPNDVRYYSGKILKDSENVIHTIYSKDTYEEVCEAAIKYCLKNLIKNEYEEGTSNIPVPKTVDEAISTLEKILSDEDREYLLKNGAISMHDSLGRWIRNEWGLWTGSELKDELMNMNKGLNHPDDMSNYIIEEFIKYWNNKL